VAGRRVLRPHLLLRREPDQGPDEAAVAGNAVVLVDHQVALLEVGDKGPAGRGGALEAPLRGGGAALLGPAENLAVGEKLERQIIRPPALAK
jgi:hypothetical protein